MQKRWIQLIALTWMITKLLCSKLWLANRLFPLVPVHDSLQYLPATLHSTLFVLSLLCMLALLFFQDKKIMAILLVSELLSCLLDQNRWQPWEYQFLLMLAAFLFIKKEKDILSACQLILAGLYFFSGLSKMNSAFIHDIWQNLVLHRWLGIRAVDVFVLRAGYLLPLAEMAAAVGLMFHKTSRFAVAVLILMHLMILLLLGPWGLNINDVIWPWNILMPLLLFLLFFNKKFAPEISFFKKPIGWFLLLCCWMLPWLQLFDYWDKYLSSVLYSGGVEQLYICPEKIQDKVEMKYASGIPMTVIPCNNTLSVYHWGMKEMQTAPYPEKRIYHAIIKTWKKRYPNDRTKFYLFKSGFTYAVREVK